MDFELSDEQKMLVDMCHDFAIKEIRPVAKELDKKVDPKDAWSWELLKKASKLGLRTAAFPKELGGSGNIATAMQLLLASLANCLEISALPYFSFANVKINSLKVKVAATYDKRAILNLKEAPLAGFYDYEITWYIDTQAKLNKVKQVLKKVERNCPVRGSFERPNKFSEEIIIGN